MWVVKIVFTEIQKSHLAGKVDVRCGRESVRIVPMEITKTPVHYMHDLSVFLIIKYQC